MHVVNISLDPKVLDATSVPSERNRLYGGIAEHFRVVVHDHKDSVLELTPTVTVYGVGGAHKVVRLFRVARLLRRLIKEGKCDVITSSDPYFFGAVGYCLARYYRIGYESHILGIEKLNPIRKAIARFFVKRAGSVRVNSTRLADRVSREFGVPREVITFVPIYVPTEDKGFTLHIPGSKEREEQDELSAQFTAQYGDYTNFVFVGRLVEVKNVAMQIKAIAELQKTQPAVRLHIIGDGPLRAELTELADNLGVTDVVIFHGRKTGYELGTFFRLSDALLLTSDAEGWPMVIFEAMTAGLTVVMTDVGCAGEMIKHEQNGLVVPVGDHSALATQLGRLITEPELKQKITVTASENIKNYWTKEQILQGYKQSWEKAYKNRK